MQAYYNEFDPKAAAWLRQLIKNGNITPGEVDERSIKEVKAGDLVGFDRVHFFAGIGTWDYCLNQAGWGDRPIWTASLPCQPFSAAGKGLGKADERHLLPHFLELVRQCKPYTIFGEQVERAIAHGWLDDLQTNMEAEGYAVGHCVLGAHSIGAPHIRQRLYWVANAIDHSGQRSVRRVNGEENSGQIRDRKDISIAGKSSGTSEHVCGMANRNEQRLQGRQGAECPDKFSAWQSGVVNGLVYANEPRSQPWRETAEAARHRDAAESTGSVNGMANTNTTGKPEQGHRQPLEERLSDGFVRSCEDGVEWIYCRDNKYRPVKPGIQPLVDGVARGMVHSSDPSEPINANATQEARATRLKGYGNAIQAQTAIAFISAYLSL